MFPPIKFQDVPSFQLQGPKQETEIDTNFLPYSLPAGPRRRPNNTHAIVARGRTSSIPDTKKLNFLLPIEESSDDHKHEIKVETENNKHNFSIVKCGPGTADQLSCRPRRYDQFPSEWQQVCWDEVQIRPSPFTEYENRNNLVSRKADTRPMPGYCGHVPRFPVKPQPGLCLKRVEFLQSSALAYRLYPESEYSQQSAFAHKGPLSKTVTTTHPFNPYSKIDRWEWKPDKLLWKRARMANSYRESQR